MNTIPLADQPSQIVRATLGGQACRIRVITRQRSLYLDLFVSDEPIVQGALCLNGMPVVRDAYRGFVGDLVFRDTQGSDDPSSPGIGSRFNLVYLGS